MMTSDDKVGGWVKKGQNHDDVILECPLMKMIGNFPGRYKLSEKGSELGKFPVIPSFLRGFCLNFGAPNQQTQLY